MTLAGDSELGLTQPLGVFSGDFRISTEDGGNKRAVNLYSNEGLWKDSLWSGDSGFDKNTVLAAARRMSTAESRVNTIERAGETGSSKDGIPLELLVSATVTKRR